LDPDSLPADYDPTDPAHFSEWLRSLQVKVAPPWKSWAEFLSNVPAVEWLYRPLLCRGQVTLLYGDPKAGKSTLTMGLVRALSHGERFLDRRTAQTPVLWLTEESPVSLYQKVPVGWEPAAEVSFLPLSDAVGTGLSWVETVAATEQWAAMNEGGVVIVDTLSAFALVEDENSASEMTRALQVPIRAARNSNVAYLLVHHANKGGGDNGRAIRGSSALYASVDIAAHLRAPVIDSDARELIVTGRFPGGRMSLDYDKTSWQYSLALGDFDD
jgi:RecA-family ATPase